MATEIAGCVLRAKDRHVTARFYSALGLGIDEHQHGGPMHYEVGPLALSCVMEVYSWSESFPQDTLMIYVDSIPATLGVVAEHGIMPTSELKEMSNMKFVYIKDPDNRPVMLIERK